MQATPATVISRKGKHTEKTLTKSRLTHGLTGRVRHRRDNAKAAYTPRNLWNGGEKETE